MADRGGHGETDRAGVERPTRGAAANPAAVASPGVAGDLLGPNARAAGEEAADLRRHLSLEGDVLLGATKALPLAPPRSRVGVGEAFGLCLLERLLLDQDALALVAPRARLKRTTTAERPLAFLARRVRAAAPEGRKTR